MRTLVLALLTALALTGAAFGQTPSTTPSPPAIGTPPANPSAIVHIKNFAYAANPVTVHVGQSIVWINDDDTPHTVTAVDASFDSGNLDKNATWTHTFTKAGTYAYYCTYHSYMKASVVVK